MAFATRSRDAAGERGAGDHLSDNTYRRRHATAGRLTFSPLIIMPAAPTYLVSRCPLRRGGTAATPLRLPLCRLSSLTLPRISPVILPLLPVLTCLPLFVFSLLRARGYISYCAWCTRQSHYLPFAPRRTYQAGLSHFHLRDYRVRHCCQQFSPSRDLILLFRCLTWFTGALSPPRLRL